MRGTGGRLAAAAALAWPLLATASGGLARTPAELLSRMDADGNGRVELVEYQAYLIRGFRALDRDGDGVVSAEELPPGVHSRGRRSSVDLTSREQALARSFARQDADASGFLDAAELAAPPR